MGEKLNQTDHELRAVLRFASGLNLDDEAVRQVYSQVCREADEAGGMSDEDRIAEVRRRLLVAAG